MPIIQTMLGGASGKYWVLDIAGETVNSIPTDLGRVGGLVLDGNDNIYFVANAREGNDYYPLLSKVNKDGQLQFQKKVGSSDSSIAETRITSYDRCLGIDSDGYLYASFYTTPTFQGNNDEDSYIVMFDTDGNADTGVASDINYQVYNLEVGVRSDDYVYHLIESRRFASADVEPYLIFHASRTHQANALSVKDKIRLNDYNGDVTAAALVVDGSNNAIIIGHYRNATDRDRIHIQKFSATTPSPLSLSRVYDKSIRTTESGTTFEYNVAYGATTDSSDNLYILGTTTYDLTSRKAAFIKLNSSGVVQWARQIDNTVTGGVNEAMVWRSAIVDSSGNLYACSGQGTAGITLLKYNSSGVLQWVRGIDTVNPSDELTDPVIRLDSNEDLIIGADGDDTNNDNHVFIIKMPSDGSLSGTYGNFTFTNITNWTDEVCNLDDRAAPLTTTKTGPAASFKTPTTANSNHTTSITLI